MLLAILKDSIVVEMPLMMIVVKPHLDGRLSCSYKHDVAIEANIPAGKGVTTDKRLPVGRTIVSLHPVHHSLIVIMQRAFSWLGGEMHLFDVHRIARAVDVERDKKSSNLSRETIGIGNAGSHHQVHSFSLQRTNHLLRSQRKRQIGKTDVLLSPDRRYREET